MSEKKKPEAKWEEAEHLGPYELHEQVLGAAHHSGELFRATHETSGVTALVFKPGTGAEARGADLPDWQVRCVSSSSPAFLSMEVEASPWSFGSSTHSAEELIVMAEGLREGVRRLTRLLTDSDERPSSPRRRLGWAVAGAVAACVLVVVLVTRQSSPLPPPVPMMDVSAAFLMAPEEDVPPPMGNAWRADTVPGAPLGIGIPFPRKPYKGQRRPPCVPRVEVEIMGACWVPHQLKAPCPEQLYEYKGQCYTTSMLPPGVPQSAKP